MIEPDMKRVARQLIEESALLAQAEERYKLLAKAVLDYDLAVRGVAVGQSQSADSLYAAMIALARKGAK